MKTIEGVPSRRVLLAEDDLVERALVSLALRRAGFAVEECRDGAEALARLSPALLDGTLSEFDLVVTDVLMPGVNGLTVLESVATCAGAVPTIVVTAYGEAAVCERARRLGAVAVLQKPYTLDELMALAYRATSPPV